MSINVVNENTGVENAATYPKLKDDLRSQQQAGFEKVIKDLSVKLMLRSLIIMEI